MPIGKMGQDIIMTTEILYKQYPRTYMVGFSNQSNGYYEILFTWLMEKGCSGLGYLIGDGKSCKAEVHEMYPPLEPLTIGMTESGPYANDYIWDITIPPPSDIPKANWIVNQAVMEHVDDPVSALRNLSSIMNLGAFMSIHTHTLGVEENQFYHSCPIDCFRFMGDFWTQMPKKMPLKLIDIVNYGKDVFVLYEKVNV